MLPLLSVPAAQQGKGSEEQPRIGSGEKFKIDLLNYLRSYSRQTCNNIIAKLTRYDFSAVRGALIASVPGRHVLSDSGGSNSTTRWGWPAMKHTLENAVPVHVPLGGGKDDKKKKSQIAIQISSIATLGPTDSWLRNTFFDALRGGRNVATGLPEAMVPPPPPPDFKVMFPTPDEIRKSLDGYGSGGSIHTKIQSPQQAKQLQYLRPMFCHWANDSEGGKGMHDGFYLILAFFLPSHSNISLAALRFPTYLPTFPRDLVVEKPPNHTHPTEHPPHPPPSPYPLYFFTVSNSFCTHTYTHIKQSSNKIRRIDLTTTNTQNYRSTHPYRKQAGNAQHHISRRISATATAPATPTPEEKKKSKNNKQ